MKIAIVQLNYIIADCAYNFSKIGEAIRAHSRADLIVFSELCITGYYPGDLLTYPQLIREQNQVIAKIKQLTAELNLAVIIGAVTEIDGLKKFHNSALVIDSGKIVYVYHKQLIPSYSVFDETRHFIAGRHNQPTFDFKGNTIALLICEDIWYDNHQGYGCNPRQLPEPVDLVIVINASPSMFGKFAQRLEIVSQMASRLRVPVLYGSQVGGYDELVYDGAGFVCDAGGQLIALADSFQEDALHVDLSCLPEKTLTYSYMDISWALVLRQLQCGLYDYVHKSGFQGIVVGCSGGIDSALTLAIAVLALGKDQVNAITMPSVYSSQGSVDDSIVLCHNLGIALFKRDIAQEFLLSCENFTTAFGKEPAKLTKENMQARIRGRIVMEYANDSSLLMLTTGNKSELAVGYATLYGDMCGALNCIGDLYKTDVYALARYINQTCEGLIPQNIMDKAPSAELAEGQKDADNLPDYYYLDAMLKLYLEGDLLQESEKYCLQSRVDEVDAETQHRIYKLIQRSEFKRKQAPPILVVQERPFGIGRRVPLTSNFNKQPESPVKPEKKIKD